MNNQPVDKAWARRKELRDFHPACPNCGEAFQVQLVRYLDTPATWKCRKCKRTWVEEPYGTRVA